MAAVIALAAQALALLPPAARAATPTPVVDPQIALAADVLLGGRFERGAWICVRVTVGNDGPALDGELRISSGRTSGSSYGLAVSLPTGARQQHFLYLRSDALTSRLHVDLVAGGVVRSSTTAAVAAVGSGAVGVVIVADRPEGLAGPLRTAASRGRTAPDIVAVAPEDLPPRAEAWSAVDLIVWQDVDSRRLDADRLDALRVWTLLGGQLVILGGSTGTGTFGGFPDDLLPFRPTATLDVAADDLRQLLGDLAPAAGTTPVLAGRLSAGKSLAVVGEQHFAARMPYGQGNVTLLGLDPASPALAGSAAGPALWSRALPPIAAGGPARLPSSDEFLASALGSLPAAQLPRTDHLLLLIVGYIIAIGPLNYLVLKRRDRREWAWLTMPLTIVGFALAAYGFGVVVKGSNVVVSELSVVLGAAGTDHGLADAHVGIFSPGRQTYDVRVGPGALVSAPLSNADGSAARPIDVLLGDPATLRDYGVGFGALRAFRAETAVSTPHVDAELMIDGDRLTGTITNSSAADLDDVIVVHAGGFQRIGPLAAGASVAVSVRPSGGGEFRGGLSYELYPYEYGGDAEQARINASRRSIIQHLNGGWDEGMSGQPQGIFAGRPVILAWAHGGRLSVELGSEAEHLGETLYVLPARVQITGPVVFSGALVSVASVSFDGADGYTEGAAFTVSRGTVSVDYRAAGVDGSFAVSDLTLRFGRSSASQPGANATDLLPLPADEQPDSDLPLAADPRPDAEDAGLPRLQLFDVRAGTWIEFEPVQLNTSYRVPEPERYVDGTGAFRARFVVRGVDYATFAMSARLAGTVE